MQREIQKVESAIEQAEPNSAANKQNSVSPSSALQTFLKTYSNFISDSQSTCTDLDKVINDLSRQVERLPPPPKQQCLSISSTPSRYEQLWRQAQNFDKESINGTAHKLKKMSDQKLYETILNIEKLHSKLNMDYNVQINRSVQLGLIHKQI